MNREDYILAGYADLEISTQIIIRAALARNIKVEILNREAQFIRLSQGTNTQLIKEATKTGIDSYITYLAMEDKHVSKLLLKEANLVVPAGERFFTAQTALDYLSKRSGDPKLQEAERWVIKPNASNYGNGVQILPLNPDPDQIKTALELAFRFDHCVLTEEFIPGDEFRFLVLGSRCHAVCRRVPANVTGDGRSTIAELIALKNQDVRRGTHHRLPLEKINATDPVVLNHLHSNQLHIDSIPPEGEQVFLRKNSNISTGGDSIDETDNMHPAFFDIATRAAQAAGARICGVDIIIPEKNRHPDEQKWAILEINFNPVLFIHEFPYQGKPRPTGDAVLDLLGFQ
ncbi:MAG: carboxylate--amine ligase [Leptospiraceae bacterium]|nr:carboxylate--amine ligase [Leptospiraceae bacterium]